jgi:tetratricopeptide (TPR) repeat protein
MTSGWLLFWALTLFTGNPLVALVVVALFLWGGEAWYRGRAWTPMAWFQRQKRVGRLRDDLAANPHDATARGQLGGLLIDRSPAEARDLLQAVHDRYPEMALVAFHLGAARLNLGDTEGGAAAIEHALSKKAEIGYGEPMIRLGDHYRAKGRHAEAADCYRRAIKIVTSSAEAYVKLGWALQAAGDRAGAGAAMQSALDVSSGAPAFKRRIDRPWRLRAWLWRTTRGGNLP